MANVKISQLTAITSSDDLADADIIPLVDSSDSTTKRAALSVLCSYFGGGGSSVWCTGTNTAYLLTDCVGIGTATPGTDIMLRVQGDSCYTGDLKIGGDVCIGGDDLFMGTNTSGHMLIADGTNFNPVAMSGDVGIDSSGATTIQASSVENSMLAGSIANAKLANDSVSYGGVSLDLGGTDATPAFNLCDATGYPTSSLVGTITNAQLAGSIANAKLANDSVSYGGVSVDLGSTDATPAFNLCDATGYPTSSLVGTITNAQLAGSIANAKLANDSVSYGGVSVDLGSSDATPAFNLCDATAYKGDSALVTVGTIASGTWNGTAIGNSYLANSSVSYGGVSVALGATDATPAFNLCDATAYKGDSALVTVGTVTSGTWQGTAVATGYIAGTICDKTLASPVLCGTISGNAFLDEDNMASDSATKVASQQSIKAYVDSVASGLDLKCSSHAATTANLSAAYNNGTSGVGATLTNSGTQAALSVDGQTMASGERVLVKDQSTAAQNGIYTVTTVGDGSSNWVLTRATDFDTSTEITSGAFTFVETGSSNADSGWVMTTDGTVTVGTTSLAWSQFSGAGQITAGDGLTKSGNTLNVGAGSNLLVSADAVAICSIVTGLTTVCATNFAGTLATAAQTNVTSLGTLTALTSSGNVSFDGGTFVFNESGADLDFRIEGDTDANLFYSDASTDRIGIGTATPDYLLSVAGNAGFDEYIYHNGDADTYIRMRGDQFDFVAGNMTFLTLDESSGASADTVTVNHGDNDIDFLVNSDDGTQLIRTDAENNRVGIGTEAPATMLHVQGDTCVTGNIIGALSTAAQTNITSLGTLTALTVDNICLDGTTIGHTSDTDLMTLADGVLTVSGRLDAANDIKVDAIRRYSDSSTTTKILLNDEVIKLNAGHASNEVVKIESGAVTIDGNITGATTICSTNLNASSVYIGGTTSANQLDNYVEGTFTPAYTAGSGSITLSTADGYYTRIGNLVYVTIKMIASAISSPSGTLVISGLPVTSANNTGGEGIGAVVHKNLVIQTSRTSPYVPFELTGGSADNIPITSVRAHAVVRVVANSTTAKLSYVDNDVSYTDAVASDIAADTEIHASFFYQV